MKNSRKGKLFWFGFGVAVGLFATGLLYYSFFTLNTDSNLNQTPVARTDERPFNVALRARADFINAEGAPIGRAMLEEGANGIMIRLDVRDLPPGMHAMHIHEFGLCTPLQETGTTADDVTTPFTQAGSHLNPDGAEHGLLNEDGPHAGDLVNIIPGPDGRVQVHMFNSRVTLADDDGRRDGLPSLLDADGSALIIHEGSDDYRTDPTGNAGGRIACARIVPE